MTKNVDTSPLLKERGSRYGPPGINLQNTARLWRDCVQGRRVHLSEEQYSALAETRYFLRVLKDGKQRFKDKEMKAAAEELHDCLGRAFGTRHGELDDRPSVQWVCRQMIALKLSRLVCGDEKHADSWRDIAGYAAIGEEQCHDSADETD